MMYVLTAAILAGTTLAGAASAATLGLSTTEPTITFANGTIDFTVAGSEGDLSTSGTAATAASSIGLSQADLGFVFGFDLAAPTTNFNGDFDVFEFGGVNDVILEGDLIAVGFTENLIELQFGELTGVKVGIFDSSILLTLSFSDLGGPNPFDQFQSGQSYQASVRLTNVVDQLPPSPVPLPAGLPLLLAGLGGLVGFSRYRKAGPKTPT